MIFLKTSLRKRLLLFLVLTTCLAGWCLEPSSGLLLAQDKKIALTFDDLPALGPLGFWRPREISNMVLRTMEGHEVKAAGFVVEEKIDEDVSGYIVLQDWISQGHTLGNQTYSDADLNELKTDDFLQHVADGQKYIRRASIAPRRVNFRYFRFPYLHQGNTESKKKDVARTLYNAGYEIAHITVKTTDYLFNGLYVENEDNPVIIEQLRTLYLHHIANSLDYSERQSHAVFNRNIRHILWLHLGVATANFLEDLISMLENLGYKFISFQEALSDPAYQTEETYVGPHGLSFIDRVAASRGLGFDPNEGELTVSDIESLLDQ